jgi:hypothetical protein
METYSQCLYASKPCTNTRSLKDNGELHRLCVFHRVKANDAQRRWHSRQKDLGSPAASPTASDAESAAKSARSKRRQSAPSTKPENASESDVAKPLKRRRYSKTALGQSKRNIARMRVPLVPHDPPQFVHLLSSMTPLYDDAQTESDALISDHELAQLDDFIGELDASKIYADFGPLSFSSVDLAFENEWLLADQHSAESTVYCL